MENYRGINSAEPGEQHPSVFIIIILLVIGAVMFNQNGNSSSSPQDRANVSARYNFIQAVYGFHQAFVSG